MQLGVSTDWINWKLIITLDAEMRFFRSRVSPVLVLRAAMGTSSVMTLDNSLRFLFPLVKVVLLQLVMAAGKLL